MTAIELRAAREASGLSIRELAERGGVAASTVWRIESGRLDPTVGMLRRLLEAAGSTSPSPLSTRESVVSLALGRRTAAVLLRDPDDLLAGARARVAAVVADDASRSGQSRW
ncbi:MAG: helix-turn-helix transcriptional regulator, partial [Acidimicrobiales bacterium]